MAKFLEYLGVLLNMEKLKKFDKVDMIFRGKQAAVMACLLARFAYMMNQEIDEDEAAEIIEEFFERESLDVHNVHDLAIMVKSTAYNPKRDRIQ